MRQRQKLNNRKLPRRPLALYGVRGLLSFYLAGCLSLAAWAAPTGRVDVLRGQADKRLPGVVQWEAVQPGDKLEEGTTVRTGDQSELQILTGRGHRFVVKSATLFELTSLQDDQTKGRLETGRVLSKVKRLREKEQFSIQTPAAVCAVRGTEFETAAGERGTWVFVYRGVVGVMASGAGGETALRAGQMTAVHDGTIELPRPIPQQGLSGRDSALARDARHEVALDMTRNQVIAAAAEERRLAEYQEGKSMTDVEGKRVRLEEYIVRSAPNQFKLVVLNERAQSQLDYFYYKGTFNKDLPTDLSVALKDLSGKIGASAPEYYLTAYEMAQSNTQDSVHDTATGGHLVKVTQDGEGNYILSDPSDPDNTRTIEAAELQTDVNNEISYKIYNPLTDSFSVVSEAQKDASNQFGVYLPENETYRDLVPADTIWKTRFNTYEHALNNVVKMSYAKSSGITNVLASAQDASWTYAGGFYFPVVTTVAGQIDSIVTNYYGDGTFESYRTVLIDDNGAVAPTSAFSGVSTGSAYRGELLKWNYEQQVTASEFEGRKIDLVVEPKIFIKSGLIQ
ncbi:MAG: FecR domain-containing protein [Elusimicrobiota bacterium]|jgi:hypothetical protein